MRTLHLFVVLFGLVPVFVFATTVWLTDGAPFRPIGQHGIRAAGEQAAASPVWQGGDFERRPTDRVPGTDAVAAVVSPEWARLNRLARDGDHGAALLLTILEGSGASAGGRRR